MHWLVEDGIHTAGHMPHVVAADLAGTVGKSIRERAGVAVKKQAGAFQRISRDCNDTSFLFLRFAFAVDVDDAIDFAVSAMFDAYRHAVWPNFQITGRFAFGNLGVQRRPFGAGLAALKAETDLLACAATVAWLTVD